MPGHFDAIVVGAGPAGATFASYLGQEGRRVLVLEASRFPRDKPCGEGILPGGVSVLDELGLLDQIYAAGGQPIGGVRYSLAGGRTARASFPAAPRGRSHGEGVGLRRLALDQILAGRARAECSVCLLEGERVTAVARLEDGWRVWTAGGGEHCAPLLVGADGYRSSIRRILGWQRPASGSRYGVIGHVRLSGRQMRCLGSDVHVVLRPGLETYFAPVGPQEALVALLCSRRTMRQAAGDLRGAYQRWVLNDPILGRHLANGTFDTTITACGPFPSRAMRVYGDGVLLLGDAAGFYDPISGEGLSRSLLGGRLGARVAERALSTGSLAEAALEPYASGLAHLTRDSQRLTRLALLICSSDRLAAAAMRGLQRDKLLLPHLLGIAAGAWGFSALSPRDWLALAAGI